MASHLASLWNRGLRQLGSSAESIIFFLFLSYLEKSIEGLLGINNELTYTHTRTDSKRKTSKGMNFPKVFIQPTFRSVFQGKLEQLFGPSRKVIVINNHSLPKRDKRSLDYTIADFFEICCYVCLLLQLHGYQAWVVKNRYSSAISTKIFLDSSRVFLVTQKKADFWQGERINILREWHTLVRETFLTFRWMFRCHSKIFSQKYCCQEILIFASYEEEGEKKKEKLENGKEQRKNTYICWNVIAGDNYILVQ